LSNITVDGRPLNISYFPSQVEFFWEVPKGVQFNCAPKGRRAGFTQGAAHFCIEKLLEGNKILWGDTISANLQRYYERYFYPILKQIDPKLWSYSPQKHQLTFGEGYVDFRSAERPENWEGFGYDVVILNEAGIILKGMRGRLLWSQSLLPMILDYDAMVYLLGTPKSKDARKDEKAQNFKQSLYYELCEKGNDPKQKKWRTINYSTDSNPLLNPESIEALRKEIPPEIRAQELDGKFISFTGKGPFKRKWFHIVEKLPPLSEWHDFVISADTAFKTDEENDNSAFALMINATNGYYILNTYNKKVEFPDLIKDIGEFHYRHNFRWDRRISKVLIEDKASGQSALQIFRRKSKLPVEGIIPKGDKYTRARATTPVFESGNVFLLRGGWNDELIDQFCEFTALLDTADDIVDAVTQAINYFESGPQMMDYSKLW
jgi:predicted phage terminase large subunit-like protein